MVRKDVGPGFAVDEYLPSCSTCQVYLKLPPYSTEEVMRVKLLQAMTMGKQAGLKWWWFMSYRAGQDGQDLREAQADTLKCSAVLSWWVWMGSGKDYFSMD